MMSTRPQTVRAPIVSSRPRLFSQPHFYFAIAFLVAVGAFWPSFFSRLSTIDTAHLIHGVTATLWMTVPILQSWFISQKRFKLHRQLGWATLAILAPTLVVSGLHMVQLMIGGYERTGAILLLKFAFLDLCAMSLFVTFLVLAVLRIRHNDGDGHMRYMAGTVLFALEPALERIFVFYVPGVAGFSSALYFALITVEAILVVLLLFEWRRRRIRLPFVMALGFFVAMHILMTPVADSPRFAEFAKWFARIAGADLTVTWGRPLTMERDERTSSIGLAGVMAMACMHRRPDATRETPAVMAVWINR